MKSIRSIIRNLEHAKKYNKGNSIFLDIAIADLKELGETLEHDVALLEKRLKPE